jgi:hypothetical protein
MSPVRCILGAYKWADLSSKIADYCVAVGYIAAGMLHFVDVDDGAVIGSDLHNYYSSLHADGVVVA